MRGSPSGRARQGLAVLVLLLTQAGCAAVTAASREDRAYHLAQRYAYDAPLEQVWPVARQVLADAGYPTIAAGDDFQAITDWQDVAGGSIAKTWVRYLVWGERLDSDRCVIRIVRAQIVLIPSELRSTTSIHSGEGMTQANPLKTGTPLGLPVKFKKAEDRAAAGVTQTAARDLKLEWEVLRRVRPGVATRLVELAGKP